MDFSTDEKRFIIVEIIKCSTADIDTLVHFLNTNNIRAEWMNMQLPHGRNMCQCIHAARKMAIQQTWLPMPANAPIQPALDIHQRAAASNASRTPQAAYTPRSVRAPRPVPIPGPNQLAHIAPRPESPEARISSLHGPSVISTDQGQSLADNQSKSALSPSSGAPISSSVASSPNLAGPIRARKETSKKRGRPSQSALARQTSATTPPRTIAPRAQLLGSQNIPQRPWNPSETGTIPAALATQPRVPDSTCSDGKNRKRSRLEKESMTLPTYS